MTGTAIKRVQLGDHHLNPGRTKHSVSNGMSVQPFPAFVSLAVVQYEGDAGYFLMHICRDGSVADTYHITIDEALHQAEWELGVKPDEWTDTDDPY